MSNRELDRLRVIRDVIEHRLKWREAAEILGLKERQIGNLCWKIRGKGNRGIIHGLRGRNSNHRLDPRIVAPVIETLKKPLYRDFGPTLAHEKLKVDFSVETLRQAMIREGLWRPKRPRAKHRQWRQRRTCVGMLVQLDGSDHDWFEGRGPRCVLVLYIDDATSRILYAEFVKVEDTLTLLRTTRSYLLKHGRPVAFYVDKDSIYKVNYPMAEESLRDLSSTTQFTRAMTELGIEVITADSPQAKGRVERSFDTHQDRLVKELRLAGISTISAANRFLWGIYIPAHNQRFAVLPENPIDAHRALREYRAQLDRILSVQTQRDIANDFTVRFQNQYFQILPTDVRIRPRQSVTIEMRLDGSWHLRHGDRYVPFKRIPKPYKPLAPLQHTVGVSKRPKLCRPRIKPLYGVIRWKEAKALCAASAGT